MLAKRNQRSENKRKRKATHEKRTSRPSANAKGFQNQIQFYKSEIQNRVRIKSFQVWSFRVVMQWVRRVFENQNDTTQSWSIHSTENATESNEAQRIQQITKSERSEAKRIQQRLNSKSSEAKHMQSKMNSKRIWATATENRNQGMMNACGANIKIMARCKNAETWFATESHGRNQKCSETRNGRKRVWWRQTRLHLT